MIQSILDIISKKYNLPTLTFFASPEQGISAKNAIVNTPEGTMFFIKNYKKSDAERRAVSEAVELFISQNSNIPVVLPLKDKTGESHIYIDREMYAVFPHIFHQEYKPEGGEN